MRNPLVMALRNGRAFLKLKKRKMFGASTGFYLYGRLFRYVRPYLLKAIVATIITIPIGALDAAVAFSLRPFLDGVLVKQSTHSVAYIPFIIVGFTCLQGILTYFSLYLNGWIGCHMVNDIRGELFQKLQTLDVGFFDENSSGMIIQRFYSDPSTLQTNVLDNIKVLLTRFFSSISLACVLLFTSWKLAIVAIFVLLCILLPSTRIKKLMRYISVRLTEIGTEMISFYNETALGIRVIYGYGLSERRAKRFSVFQKEYIRPSMKYVKTQGWMTPSMHIIASVGIAIIIWYGSHEVVKGQMTTGAFVSFLAALIMLYNPVKNIGHTVMATQQSLLAAGRVFDLLDIHPKINDRPEAQELRGIQDSIIFDHVTFEYSPGKPVLKDMSIRFKAGETVALVGDSGGGKSTIASLIPRFYDVTTGAIRVDGVDIRDLTLKSLREQISLVTQDNFLFNGTLRDNLLVGNPDATEAEINDAIERAYLRPFVDSLEAKLETFIGERGVLLSGGQRQRVAIARALLKNTPIVILDEATSALDNQSEAIVQKAIEALMEDRTVIVIAHRLSTIRNADRILVVSDGRIIEEGSHEDLLAQDGTYAMLYYTQFKTKKQQSASLEALNITASV